MLMSEIMKIHLMRKRYTLIFHIQTLSLTANNFSLQILWIKLNKCLLLIKS